MNINNVWLNIKLIKMDIGSLVYVIHFWTCTKECQSDHLPQWNQAVNNWSLIYQCTLAYFLMPFKVARMCCFSSVNSVSVSTPSSNSSLSFFKSSKQLRLITVTFSGDISSFHHWPEWL